MSLLQASHLPAVWSHELLTGTLAANFFGGVVHWLTCIIDRTRAVHWTAWSQFELPPRLHSSVQKPSSSFRRIGIGNKAVVSQMRRSDPDGGIVIRRMQQTHDGRGTHLKQHQRSTDPVSLSLMTLLATGEFVVSDLFKQRVVHDPDDPDESDREPSCCEMTGYYRAGRRHHLLPEGE